VSYPARHPAFRRPIISVLVTLCARRRGRHVARPDRGASPSCGWDGKPFVREHLGPVSSYSGCGCSEVGRSRASCNGRCRRSNGQSPRGGPPKLEPWPSLTHIRNTTGRSPITEKSSKTGQSSVAGVGPSVSLDKVFDSKSDTMNADGSLKRIRKHLACVTTDTGEPCLATGGEILYRTQIRPLKAAVP